MYIYIHTPFINPEWKISFSSKLLQVGTCDDQFLDTVYGDGVPDVHLYFLFLKDQEGHGVGHYCLLHLRTSGFKPSSTDMELYEEVPCRP